MTTALDRYRAAKLALDTFGAFTKDMARAKVATHLDAETQLSSEASITTKNRNRQQPVQQNVGFNHFVARWIMAEREGLAAEYRETLVVAASKAKIEADAEARAVMRENSPI